ncbi:MAG TPA: nucleotidyltransferase domain-containing protein [Polyangia bacterium]|nr:nucleotidyltransferase domain-containing protein [Polyangia bacterium]
MMRSLKATELRRQLYQQLDEVERRGTPLEVLRFGRPVAVLGPAPSARQTRRKPLIDLDAIAAFCKRHQVDAFSLFGSILRDDFGAQSDVDVLIDTAGRSPSFHETCRMLDELEAMFGRKVDLLTKGAVESPQTNRHRRASILSSARLLYERPR